MTSEEEQEIAKRAGELLIPVHDPATGKTSYVNLAQLIGGINIYVNTTNKASAKARAKLVKRTLPTPPAQPQKSFFSMPNLKAHYLYFIGGTIALSYFFVCYKLKRAVWMMENRDSWCNWKVESSLEKLFSFSQEELAEELLVKIQSRYSNPRTPGDLVTPLSEFLDHYKREINILRHYVKTTQWLRSLRLAHFFPVREEDVLLIQEKTQRLAFLKTLFFLWTTHHVKDKNSNLQKKISRTFSIEVPSF